MAIKHNKMNRDNMMGGYPSKQEASENDKIEWLSQLYEAFDEDENIFCMFLCLKIPSMTPERAHRIVSGIRIYRFEKMMKEENVIGGMLGSGIMIILSHVPESNQHGATTATPESGDKVETPIMGEEGGGHE